MTCSIHAAVGHPRVTNISGKVAVALQASQRHAQQQLDRTNGNLDESMLQISMLETDVTKAGTRYTFLQEMRSYIADLCEMLDVRVLHLFWRVENAECFKEHICVNSCE